MPRPAVLLTLLFLAPPAAAQELVGAQVCRSCHPQAFEIWRKGPHATAENRLGAKASDPSCTSCHAPRKQAGQPGVSCETCHGPGQHYSPAHVMRDAELARLAGLKIPDEKACRGCHDATSPSLRPYDHAAMMKAIDHWTADREARKPRVQSR